MLEDKDIPKCHSSEGRLDCSVEVTIEVGEGLMSVEQN